ncbi:acyl-[acyl-carrier-protein] thioesterase [Ethanoligenens harbinense]|uniref:acyl-[acyl-carrier-protein] thioesterase n=1 Tax=Ethanoligenens harbinense TaxID=253239 RepID=UPI0001C523B7|nr:acyl-ACP thioesterase domain-containing protein [Ethanoligenens harbinense]
MESYILPVHLTSFDIGATRKMKYSMILRLLQEAAGRHLEELGLSYSVLREQYGMVFLLVEAAVRIHRLPAYGETVDAETWFCGVEGVKFGRGLRICSGDELCIELGSHWVLVDPDTHRIVRPSKFPVPEGMQTTSDGPMPVPLEKQRSGLLFSSEGEPVPGVCRAGKRVVRYSDLDSNGHVNNAVYVDMLCDFFPDGFSGHAFSGFKIDFLGEAKEQETIGIRARRQGNTVFFEGQVETRPCFVASATVVE